MSKERLSIGQAVSEFRRAGRPLSPRAGRLGMAAALGAALVLCGPDVPHAQQRNREPEVTVTGINASGGTVSITATGSLNRAQTWQDAEGFHVVLPNGRTALGGTARGVRVQRVGNSLELIVPVRAGARVTVQPRGERLDLVVDGGHGAAPATGAGGENHDRALTRQAREAGQANAQVSSAVPRGQSGPAPGAPRPRPEKPRPVETTITENYAMAGAAPKFASAHAEQPPPAGGGNPPAPEPAAAQAEAPPATTPAVEVPVASADLQSGGSLGSVLFSLPALLVALGLGLVGALAALVLRRRKAGAGDEAKEDAPAKKSDVQKNEAKQGEAKKSAEAEAVAPFEQLKGDRRQVNITVPFERRRTGLGAQDSATREQKTLDGQPKGEPVNPALPAVAFGAYRIDQEVSLLVAGRPHSVEVISSRASDDRRAVATSLRKALREADEDGCRRARMALEDYGFVARECAALLLGAESFERASAAHALGEMRSPQSLPFLTEALYDTDAVVRIASVQSLGALGLPSAIGALLDTARRHPEIPSDVIGPALTACSVEPLEIAWESPADPRAGADSFAPMDFTAGDVRMIEPACGYEELPDWLEDEALTAALRAAERGDDAERTHAAQALAQFQVRRAVETLARLATEDAESNVRAAAVTSLGLINHESVFVPVIVAMADGAREVRAAAARALSRLSFDRADAYVRVFESSDARALREVARSCVAAGLVGQAVARLSSQDRRQSYEAFSLLSLAVKAGEVEPLVEAIESHRDTDVRLACVGLLAQTHEPELAARLQMLADRGGVPERVRAALRDTLARLPEPVQ